MALEIKNLSFSYASKKNKDLILNNLNLEVKQNQIVGLLGRNGAGKSTLFNLLTGLLESQSGDIKFVKREELGVVFQNPSLDKNLTALENLNLSAKIYGLDKNLIKIRAEKYLDLVGLKEFVLDKKNQKIKTFSGGMKRRLELARAFMHAPKFLLMDEPSTGLDEAGVRDYWGILKTLQREHRTTIFLTTHRVDEAARCDRLLILHNGQIIADETPSRFCSRVSEDQIKIKFKQNFENQDFKIFKTQNGPEDIPKLVSEYGADNILSLEMRRPSLADAFLKITGEQLHGPV